MAGVGLAPVRQGGCSRGYFSTFSAKVNEDGRVRLCEVQRANLSSGSYWKIAVDVVIEF